MIVTRRRCMSCLLVGTHSRTCPDLGLLTLRAPARMSVGEIIYPDGRKVLVPQPTTFEQWPPVVRGRYTGEDTEVLTVVIPREPEAEDTLAGGLSWTGVIEAIEKGPESHAEPRTWRGPVPVWPMVLVFLGAVLMAFGFVLNEPVSRALWALLHQ